MTDDSKNRKPKGQQFHNWKNQPYAPAPEAARRRKELWAALNSFVTQNGGAVTSLPGKQEMRIEIPFKSALPAKLLSLGYKVQQSGTSTRVATSGKIEPVMAISISLPAG